MASVQCCKPAEKSCCHQGHQDHSLSQKVSGMASSIFKGHGSHHSDGQPTECCGQTQGHCPHHTTSHTSQNQCMSQTNGHKTQHDASGTAMACQGKTKKRGEHKKRGLLQKIKDGISGDDSSSSSDSESDDDKCGTKKASY
ncbi:hypothetical protein QUC31_009043 [Theobroma cacao]|nr:hypothetical protein QQP08_011802 [Theobroma cacao]